MPTVSRSSSTREFVRPLSQPSIRGTVAMLSGDGHVGEEAYLLDHVPDPASELVRVGRSHVLAVEEDPAARRLDDAVDHLHRRGLAATARPHEDDYLTLVDVHREVVHRRFGLPRERFGKVL